MSRKSAQRILIINLPDTVIPDNYTLTLIAISMNSGQFVKVRHEIMVKVLKKSENGPGPKPNGTQPNGTKDESDILYLIVAISIVVIIIIILILTFLIMKRKKKGKKELISTVASTVKPSAQESTEIIIGEARSESMMVSDSIRSN